ncbi:MAG: DUF397 domain-containing protein [Streptosporangiaceae bacterium]|jgi:hypothetical protein
MDSTSQHRWRTSSYTGANGGNCVEVGHAGHLIAVRDTKDRPGPVLAFSTATWQQFAAAIKTGIR